MKEPIELVFAAHHEGERDMASAGSLAEASRLTAERLGFEAQIQDRVVDGYAVPGSYVVTVSPPKLTPEEAQRIHALDQGTAGMGTLGAGTAAFYQGALEHSDEATARIATWLYIRGLLGKPPVGA